MDNAAYSTWDNYLYVATCFWVPSFLTAFQGTTHFLRSTPGAPTLACCPVSDLGGPDTLAGCTSGVLESWVCESNPPPGLNPPCDVASAACLAVPLPHSVASRRHVSTTSLSVACWGVAARFHQFHFQWLVGAWRHVSTTSLSVACWGRVGGRGWGWVGSRQGR